MFIHLVILQMHWPRIYMINFLKSYTNFLLVGGIGAFVYNVPDLENDQRLKISLRSVENEDTTPISQVVSLSNCAHNCIVNVTLVSYTRKSYLKSFSLLFGIWRWGTSKCKLFHVNSRWIWTMEGMIGFFSLDMERWRSIHDVV